MWDFPLVLVTLQASPYKLQDAGLKWMSLKIVFVCLSEAFSSGQNTLVTSFSSTAAIPDLAIPVRSLVLLGLVHQNTSEDSNQLQGTLLDTLTFPVSTLSMLVVRISYDDLVVEPGISLKGYITISPMHSSHAVHSMCPVVLFRLDDSLPILRPSVHLPHRKDTGYSLQEILGGAHHYNSL